MIRFLAEMGEGRKLIGLGLSRQNVEKLQANMPILIKLNEMLPELNVELNIAILYGETEAAIEQMLEKEFGSLPLAEPVKPK